MKKILTSMLAAALLTLAGCQPGGGAVGSGPVKTYKLEGGNVSFSAPPAPWKEELSQDKQDAESVDKGITVGVGFRKPEHDGFLSVGTMSQRRELVTNPKTKIEEPTGKLVELENDKETLNMLATWVYKRDGEIVAQEYIPVAGANAYHMTFEMGRPEKRMKGQQIHFTKDGTHYSISMLAPVKDYPNDVPHFQNIVSSLKVESTQPKTAAKP